MIWRSPYRVSAKDRDAEEGYRYLRVDGPKRVPRTGKGVDGGMRTPIPIQGQALLTMGDMDGI